MADSTIPNLTEVTTPADTDLMYTVVNPATTPADRKVQLKNARGSPVKDRAWTRGSAVNALDDEFNDASLAAAWVRYDTTASIVTYTEAADVLSINHIGSSGDNSGPAHCLLKPLGGLTYPLTIEWAARAFRRYATSYHMMGLIMSEGTVAASKNVWADCYGHTNVACAMNYRTNTYNTLNGGEIAAFGGNTYEIIGGLFYQRLRWSAANTFQTEYSPDGVSWLRHPTADITFTCTPTHIGFAVSSWGTASPQITSVEYFRVY